MDQTAAEALFARYLARTGPALCLDIGTGTQDVLLAVPGEEAENWPKFVLPSPALLVERRLHELAKEGRSVWLTGTNMGGGFLDGVRDCQGRGLRVAATLEASRALHNDPDRVRALGIDIVEECPAGCVPVHVGDLDVRAFENMLLAQRLPLPGVVLAAVQDHGFAGRGSGSRLVRMARFARLLDENADPRTWLFSAPPAEMTRLGSLHRASGGPVADTATAVLLGGMLDETLVRRSFRQGVTFVNVGNGHVFAALLYRGLVRGIYEHHTQMRTREQLLADLAEFRRCFLPADVVQQSGGHGTAYGPPCEEAGGYEPTFVCGPKRRLLQGAGQMVAPFGSMMLAGCFGLLWAAASLEVGAG